MDTLADELKELKTFVTELKADRAAAKEKEKRESWTKYTSLSLVVIAVLAAIATQWSGKYGSRVLVQLNDSTFQQAKASDQWAFFQSKSIKQNLYEVAREQLSVAAAGPGGEGAKQTAEKMAAKIEKYDKEKKEVQNDAKKLEELRDTSRVAATEASRKGSGMGLAVAVFQIAIAMGSICLVTKRKALWYMALGLAALATYEMLKVWLT